MYIRVKTMQAAASAQKIKTGLPARWNVSNPAQGRMMSAAIHSQSILDVAFPARKNRGTSMNEKS
ncbi:hypothetical protein FBQ83_02280 [Chloroflexi bacterium CFX5]|nr:hypothetical protein [Chloroflexi bacterium CFX5]